MPLGGRGTWVPRGFGGAPNKLEIVFHLGKDDQLPSSRALKHPHKTGLDLNLKFHSNFCQKVEFTKSLTQLGIFGSK